MFTGCDLAFDPWPAVSGRRVLHMKELMDIAERKRRLDSVSNYRVSLLKWGRNRRATWPKRKCGVVRGKH